MDSVELKIWLLRAGYSQSIIAKDLTIKPQTVWKAINGKGKNSRVVQWLKDHFCPEHLIEGLLQSENGTDC